MKYSVKPIGNKFSVFNNETSFPVGNIAPKDTEEQAQAIADQMNKGAQAMAINLQIAKRAALTYDLAIAFKQGKEVCSSAILDKTSLSEASKTCPYAMFPEEQFSFAMEWSKGFNRALVEAGIAKDTEAAKPVKRAPVSVKTASKPYFLLVGKEDRTAQYEMIFGDYSRQAVEDEKDDTSGYVAKKIIKCGDSNAEIVAALKLLNGSK